MCYAMAGEDLFDEIHCEVFMKQVNNLYGKMGGKVRSTSFPAYNLKGLSHEDLFHVFIQERVIKETMEKLRPDLKEIGNEIVAKC